MNKKIVFAMTMMLCLSMIFSACGSNESVNNNSAVPKIVFRNTIDDPQAEYLNTLGGAKSTGKASLDLTLYEIEPDVFEGYGIMTRALDMPEEGLNLKQEYIYRTGLIHAKAGQEGRLTLTGEFTEDREVDTIMGEDAPLRFISHKDGTALQKDLPFLLKLEGEKASLSIKIHDHANLAFEGKLTTDSAESPARDFPKPESLIYINSLWSGSFMGGSGDYTAILLATPTTNKNSYSGQLSINGNGTALESIKEKVTFSLEQFDDAFYQKLGGKLNDRFASMGVLHTAGSEYILLLDGEQVILEAVGKDIFFYGKLRSNAEAAFLQNEADKTSEILSYLSRQKSNAPVDYSMYKGLDPKDPEDMEKLTKLSEELDNMLSSENGAPAWYPDRLIPKVNFSEDDGYLTTPAIDAQFFKLYITEYYENENFADLISPYRAALSGLDDYKEHLDLENGEGVFLFTMGRYSVQVFLQQSSLKLTSVGVQIY